MATIPVGNFGQVVATPTPAIQRNAGEFGAGAAKALGDLAQTGSAIVTQQMAQQTRLDQEVADREAQTTAASRRITKANQLADAQATLDNEVMTGKVPKDKAAEEWNYRSSEILRDATSGIDPRYAGAMQVEFDGIVQRGASNVRTAVTKRNQNDVQANLLTLGEEYQRAAQRDRQKATAEYFAQLDVMGPEAGWAPDFIAQKKQAFKEGTAYTEAFGLVRGASRDLNAVRSAREALGSDRFADLDPQKSAALHAQLDGYETNILQRQEIAAQRAQRESEARLNRARSAFEASQARVLAGIPDNPDQIAATTQALAGTPYLDTYRAQQQQAREIGGLAAQPVPQQQALLDALNAKIAQGGTSDALIKQRDQVQRAVEASKRDLTQDPMRAGLERGVISDIPPVDVSSIQAFTSTLGRRLEAASVVQSWAGRAVSPLTTEEASQLSTTLSALPPQQRASALAQIGTVMGPKASAGLAAQLDKQDKATALALQFGAKKTTEGRYTSELILRGQQALKEKVIKPDTSEDSGWRAAIADAVGDAFMNENQRADIAEAAYLITAGWKAEGKFSPNPKKAVDLAVGGKVVDFNGKKVPLPPGMDDGDLTDRLKNITGKDIAAQAPGGIVRVGGQDVPVEDLAKALPDSQLMYAAEGAYYVLSGARVVTNAQNKPIVIKVNSNAR